MLGTESALGGTEVGVDVPTIYGAEYTLTLGPLHSLHCPVRLRRSLSRADIPHFGGRTPSARPLLPSTRHTGVSAVSISVMARGALATYLPVPRAAPEPRSVPARLCWGIQCSSEFIESVFSSV